MSSELLTDKLNVIKALDSFITKPGLMSKEELLKLQDFFQEYKKYHDVYVSVFNREPLGHTLSSHLNTLKFYIDRQINKDKQNDTKIPSHR